MFGRLKQIYKDEWEWRKDDFPILSEVAKKTGSISEFVSEYILNASVIFTEALNFIKQKNFLIRTPAPQRGQGYTPGTPYGADLNNHSELTRQGFRSVDASLLLRKVEVCYKHIDAYNTDNHNDVR